MQKHKNKFFVLLIAVATVFCALILKLVYLQLIRGEDYEDFSIQNHVRIISKVAPRGRIIDRNGVVIVENKLSFNVEIFPYEVRDIDFVSASLASYLGKQQDEIKKLISRAEQNNYFSFTLARNIDRDMLVSIESMKYQLSGVIISVDYLRKYPKGKLGASLVGYMGKPNEDDLARYPISEINSPLGKTGIERNMENFLRGSKGVSYQIVDAIGREVESDLFQIELTDKEITPGSDIFLTIDSRLQKVAEDELSGKAGSIVVVNVNTGEVLALVTSPSFSPESFVGGIDPTEWDELTNNELKLMLNRSTQGTYPPGSLFKIVTAIAALKEGIITTQSKFFCPGHYKIGEEKFHCWDHSGHGWQNMYSAMSRSCDVFFYEIARKLGVKKLYEYANIFGFGKKTGIEINEKKGLVPNKHWKKKVHKEIWYPGETIIMAIGQGYLQVTPIQVAFMTAAIANGGTILKARVIRKIVSNDDQKEQTFLPEIVGKLPFEDWHIQEIKNSLVGVIEESYGTGRLAKIEKGTVAGKTATSQVVSRKKQSSKTIHKDHAWFTSYYPAESPEIAVTVLVEHGVSGGGVAAPIAKRVIDEYANLEAHENEDNSIKN